MKSESAIRSELRRWILSNGGGDAKGFDDQTPIFRDGILKSVHIMDLILLVEELSGRSLEIEELNPRSFGSIDAIYDTFFCGREMLT
jgi:hypothetical protein